MAFASWSTKLKRFIGLDPPSCDSCVPRARGPRRRNGVPGAGDCCSACFSVCCCCCACGFGVKVGKTSLSFRILSNFRSDISLLSRISGEQRRFVRCDGKKVVERKGARGREARGCGGKERAFRLTRRRLH